MTGPCNLYLYRLDFLGCLHWKNYGGHKWGVFCLHSVSAVMVSFFFLCTKWLFWSLLFQQYADQNRHVDALNAWRNATMLKPDHSLAWNNMVILLDNTGIKHTHAKGCTRRQTALSHLLSLWTVFTLSFQYKAYVFFLSSKGVVYIQSAFYSEYSLFLH